MMNKLMALFAFTVLALFLGILIWHVPRLDLGAIVVFTLALVVYDFITSNRKKRTDL